MTKSSKTRSALFTSIISLLLCVSMLVGTTFAWFTDSVESGRNLIAAGNLDVELYHSDRNESNVNVDGSTKLFNDVVLWEPGAVLYDTLQVKNVGTLALKYQLDLSVLNETVVNGNKLSDVIKVGVVNGALGTDTTREGIIGAVTSWTPLSDFRMNQSGVKMEVGGEDTFTVVLYWQPNSNEIDNLYNMNNENQGKKLELEIGVNLYATQLEAESDSFDDQYDVDAMVEANTQEEAQAALDNAVSGTVIVLKSGVDYGTLYLRQSELSKSVDITDWAGDGDHERYRKIENLTILGNGATVDAIVTESSTYAKEGGNNHSGDMQWLDSYIEIKDLVVKGVNFTGEAAKALGFSEKVSIDGLTIEDCTLVDENGDSRLFYTDIATTSKSVYTDKTTNEVVMTRVMENISIIDCKVTGAYQVAEFRGTENITITGNTSTGIIARDYLLSGDSYTGVINISNNISEAGEERFVRAAINGDATVTITNNTIIGYKGVDADYIKVTDATGTVTIENNTISYGSAASAQAALDAATDGATINLVSGVNYGTLYLRQSELSKSVDITDWAGDGDVERYRKIKNLTILGNGAAVDAIRTETSTYAKEGGNDHSGDMKWLDSYIEIENLVVDGVNFTGEALNAIGFNEKASINGLTIKNCVLNDADGDSRLFYTDIANKKTYTDKTTGEIVMTQVMKNISIIDCKVTGAYQVAEFRGTENITITGNTSTGIKARDYLLSGDVYSGTITISNNISEAGEERFVRAAINSEATVTITNNTIIGYKGADADYIKVTGATGTVTIENNIISYAD